MEKDSASHVFQGIENFDVENGPNLGNYTEILKIPFNKKIKLEV